MDAHHNKQTNTYQHLDYPSFDQSTTTNQDESSLGLVELSLNLRNQLNSLRSIKKNFTKRFDNLLMSSDKKEVPRETTGYEQKYNELKAKYDELEEVHQNHIDETLETLRKSREGYEKKIKGLDDELTQKNNYIEVMKQGQVQTQEKVNLLEARIASLEQLNNTLTSQLKDKAKELSGSTDNTSTSMTSRSRDMVLMKTDFAKIVDRVGGLEDIINNLKEGKKQDMKALEESRAEKEDLKAENFQLLLENKKLKNEIEELHTKFSSVDKCLLERRQKTDEFINTLAEYQNSFQVINQVNLDLETVFEPLKEQNRRLLAEKEKLSEENRNMKVKLASLEDPKQRRMEEEVPEESKENNGEQKKQDDAANEAKSRGIDLKFYVEIMDKLKEFEKQTGAKDKEISDLQTELEELKSRNLELETKIISINRSPKRKSYEQYLTVDVESHMASSPRRKKNDNPNSPQNSEMTREVETDRDVKEIDTKKDNQDAMEDEADKDARLKITRKQKQIKKPAMMNLLTGITICPNCSLIIKKADKNVKDCTKCHGSIHEKCMGDQKNGMCNPCNDKVKKSSQGHQEDEDENEGEKEKSTN